MKFTSTILAAVAALATLVAPLEAAPEITADEAKAITIISIVFIISSVLSKSHPAPFPTDPPAPQAISSTLPSHFKNLTDAARAKAHLR